MADSGDEWQEEEGPGAAGGGVGAAGGGPGTLFAKELRCMLYGFGDERNPYTETVELVEELVVDFITHVTLRALEVGRPGKVSVEDIIYVIHKDPKKYSRVKELLTMNEELKKARKAFDEAKY